MNGFDHMPPDPHTAAVADALVRLADADITLQRGLLGCRGAWRSRARCFEATDRLRGPLLPACGRRGCAQLAKSLQVLLEGWASRGRWGAAPVCPTSGRRALALAGGAAEPRARLHLRMPWMPSPHVRGRFRRQDRRQTVGRLLERLGGLDCERRVPWTLALDVVVFKPTPAPLTDVVRVPLDAYPAMTLSFGRPALPPLPLACLDAPGFAINGQAARVVSSDDPTRVRWLSGQTPVDLEFVAADVPAFGCRRFRLTPCERVDDTVDAGRVIESGDVRVAMDDDGTLCVRFGGVELACLLALEDRGDRGDTYDFDPVADEPDPMLEAVACERRRHPSGIARLVMQRLLRVPAGLDRGRERRSAELVPLTVWTEACIVPGVPRVDLTVRVDNTARDHRLRLRFPTHRPVATFHAATTFVVPAVHRPSRRFRLATPRAADVCAPRLDPRQRPHRPRAGSSGSRGHARWNDRRHAAACGRLAGTRRSALAPTTSRSADAGAGGASARSARGAPGTPHRL
jgi:hypothetical protein